MQELTHREEKLALLKVDGLLFSDSEIAAFGDAAWPAESHVVPNQLDPAWDALKDAATNTGLVSLLYAPGDDSDLLRRGTREVVAKIKTMLQKSRPLAFKRGSSSRVDHRVAGWKKQLKEWENSIFYTGDLPKDVAPRLAECRKVVEALVEESARMKTMGSGPARDKLSGQERAFRGDLASGDVEAVVLFQNRQAKRATTQVFESINMVSRAKKASVGLKQIDELAQMLRGDSPQKPDSDDSFMSDSDSSGGETDVRPP